MRERYFSVPRKTYGYIKNANQTSGDWTQTVAYKKSSCNIEVQSKIVTPESDHVPNILLRNDSACLAVPPIRLPTLTTMRTGYVLDLVPDKPRDPYEHLLEAEGVDR